MYYSVKDAKAVDDSKLYLRFEDGKCGIYDMTPLLSEGVFRKLADRALFNAVRSDGFTAVWPNGLDVAPEELYENALPLDCV